MDLYRPGYREGEYRYPLLGWRLQGIGWAPLWRGQVTAHGTSSYDRAGWGCWLGVMGDQGLRDGSGRGEHLRQWRIGLGFGYLMVDLRRKKNRAEKIKDEARRAVNAGYLDGLLHGSRYERWGLGDAQDEARKRNLQQGDDHERQANR